MYVLCFNNFGPVLNCVCLRDELLRHVAVVDVVVGKVLHIVTQSSGVAYAHTQIKTPFSCTLVFHVIQFKHFPTLTHVSMSPSVSLEKDEDTEVVVLGVRPSTLSDS